MGTYISDLVRDFKLDFIGIQETMKKYFSPKFLRKIDSREAFSWKWIPSEGKSGGILGGFRSNVFDLVNYVEGKYLMNFELWNKILKMKCCILVVY